MDPNQQQPRPGAKQGGNSRASDSQMAGPRGFAQPQPPPHPPFPMMPHQGPPPPPPPPQHPMHPMGMSVPQGVHSLQPNTGPSQAPPPSYPATSAAANHRQPAAAPVAPTLSMMQGATPATGPAPMQPQQPKSTGMPSMQGHAANKGPMVAPSSSSAMPPVAERQEPPNAPVPVPAPTTSFIQQQQTPAPSIQQPTVPTNSQNTATSTTAVLQPTKQPPPQPTVSQSSGIRSDTQPTAAAPPPASNGPSVAAMPSQVSSTVKSAPSQLPPSKDETKPMELSAEGEPPGKTSNPAQAPQPPPDAALSKKAPPPAETPQQASSKEPTPPQVQTTEASQQHPSQPAPRQPGPPQMHPPQEPPPQQPAVPAMGGQPQLQQPPSGHPPAGPMQPQPQQPAGPPPAHPQPSVAGAAALQEAAAGGMRELRVEDALLYLDHVKMEFKDRPHVYNQFLSIMKNFKSQEVDTPGVIRQVSKLFRGYNSLILGFNTFLPDGYKISLADLEQQEREERAREQAAHIQRQSQPAQQAKPPPSGPGAKRMAAGPTAGQPRQWGRPAQESVQQQMNHQEQQQPPHMAMPSQPQQQQQQQQQQQPKSPPQQQQQRPPAQQQQQQQAHVPQNQVIEFDHAISYVTTIKRRFANDPSTYHQFLEILHTYQKEQRGIKEVLEQVAHLFQDHPDLLKEFTFFLPDAVQEQAKERLHRAAAESESRQALQRQQQMEQYQRSMATASTPAGSHQKFIDMTRSQIPMVETDARGRKRALEGQQGAAQYPESAMYNSAVERQFFDAAREALTSYTRDGGQAWAEFLKCLDMYAQDILSRNEMLNFVEPLLGKRNTKLFEEFKRILSAAGSSTHPVPLMEDSWHSVPLSEIDFSRCRRCSPSYRALPRDYPNPPCSGRSEEETKVLNDIWVSLPVGSEESYTFRHMRRNTYEEMLFRVEDERFEIDMVIDSNATTLQRLEPVAQEIAELAQEEPVPADLGTKPAVEGTGMGGRRFQYTFDKSILGVIHRNAIVRIYGDQGQEMLDLLVQNPTVAVPVVVQRLRQKDVEWRAVRDRLNRQWKELSLHNYYKSLDHRGLTFRTIDKRATSTRTLISEIKDRAANRGKEGPEALKQKLDKAKEEHGSFYEVTMAGNLSDDLDLTFLPKPDRRLFTPHLSLMYENNSWAQRDAYRILAFALERGNISPADKERCHRLWIDFLGPWFGLSLNWMQRPAVTYMESTAAPVPTTSKVPSPKASVVSEDDDEESMEEELVLGGNVVTEEMRQNGSKDAAGREFTDHHPLPAGAHVSTLYGEGKIIEFRRSDNIYVVELGFGIGAIGYLRPATVLCSILPVEKSAFTRQLRTEDRSKLARPNDQLVIGTQSLYLFFRLHQILVRRLNIAKRLAYSVGDDVSLKTLVVEQMPNSTPQAAGRRRYEAYLSLVYALLDGGVSGAAEGGKYEDRVRGLLGHGAYELATMDKLIWHIWKNIQAMAGDETMWNLVQLYRRHLDAGSFQPEAFRQEAAYHSEGELMYAFQYCPVQGKDSSVIHMDYIGVMDNASDEDDEMEEEEHTDEQETVEPANKRPRR